MKRSLLLFSLLLTVVCANAQLSGYYQQGFEDAKFPPQGWDRTTVKGDKQWVRSTTASHSGKASAYDSYSDPKPVAVNYLFSPQYAAEAGDSLSFWFTPQFSGFTDSLMVEISTTNKAPKSFTTIATFADGDNYPIPGTWERVSLSLGDYAGQNIFIAFKHTNYKGDGIYIDDVAFGTAPPDAKAVSIDIPGTLTGGSTISPMATFQNLGSQSATFDVTFTAGSYTSTKTITNLASQNTEQVTFDPWNIPATPATYNIVAYTALSGDVDNSNDTVKTTSSVYSTFSAYWIKAKHTPAPGFDIGTTSYSTGTTPNDTTYLVQIGGVADITASQATKSGRKFNTKTNDWSKIAPVPEPRFTAHAFYYNGKIFYIGGYHASFFSFYNAKDVVSIYDIATDTWSEGSPMLSKVGGYASCQQDSLIYIIGGFNGNVFENKVQVYNIITDSWSKGTNIPGVREGFSAGITGNKIVYTGGQNETGKLDATTFVGTINASDPTKIKWTQVSDYPGGHAYRLAATGIKNASSPMVYFTGGSSNGAADASKAKTWAYNTNTNEWLKGPNKPTQVSNITDFAPFVYNDTVYIAVIGGIDQNESVVNANEWLVLGPTSQVLPIHLLDFSATLQNNKTLLNWKVAEDGTGGYYIIQRSSDAIHFADMSDKLNAGRIATTKAYSSYDLLPMKGYNYYRIKIVNADGSIAYSAIKAVNNNSVSASVYASSVYPNPTRGLLNILLQNNSGAETTIGVAISDVAGRKIINETKTVGVSSNLSYNLKPGTYVVNMFSEDGTWKQSVKVVVQ